MKTKDILKLISSLKSNAGDLMSIMDDIGSLSQRMKIISENMEEVVKIAKNITNKAEGMFKDMPKG